MTAMVLAVGAMLRCGSRPHPRGARKGRGHLGNEQPSLRRRIEHVQSLKTVKTYGAQQRSAGIFAALSAGVARSIVVRRASRPWPARCSRSARSWRSGR